MRRSLVLALVAVTPACSSTPSASSPADLAPASPDLAPSNALVTERPYAYDVPDDYDGTRPTPLLVLLHGYSVSGVVQRLYFGLNIAANTHGFLLAYPDGTRDSRGNPFWNATDACCDFDGSGVDDVAYIDAVIDDMRAHFNIDPGRVFLTGHSNGGFMAHRYACDRAGRVAAIAALAGHNWKDETRCVPAEPVAILQVHGDHDEDVSYDGDVREPSARESVAGWAKKNGCAAMPTDTSQPALDLDKNLAGDETARERWTGCRAGGAAELWTIRDGGHIPMFRLPVWPDAVWSWLSAHPKQ